MFTLPFILAAGSLPLILGAPVASNVSGLSADVGSEHSLKERGSTTYITVFGGNGEVSNGWPEVSAWVEFNQMFDNNKDEMSKSCAQWGVENTQPSEMTSIKNHVESLASSSGVDKRVIFAVIMQESNGCVRAPTSDNGASNPGLMQSYYGTGSCNNGTVLTPCPDSVIGEMVADGTTGTNGLQYCLNRYGGTGNVANYYKALVCYNAGSVPADGNLGQNTATPCYASDVVNRLLGWDTGPSSCTSDVVKTLTSSHWSGSSSSGSGDTGSDTGSSSSSSVASSANPAATYQPTTTWPAAATTTTSSTSVYTPPAEAETTTQPAWTPTASAQPVWTPTTTSSTVAPAANTVVPSAASGSGSALPKYPYAISSCQQYTDVEEGDYCEKVESQYGITLAQFLGWNPGLYGSCSNLWKGYQYCVKA
ncbi:uncharacterized protein N7459_009904 [Penicillium hispanicum]|uniref:uncharacterized protein n=1 Tax=Penicillium hispanicum TaxID=1080232 RepID=UPI00253FBEBA|nr:uncharacterized protein N7459_009904 [Penicillium hispanicum]KAJ5570474.1 hypothetical protein N7459_009904 [Penicillium hispanicum]